MTSIVTRCARVKSDDSWRSSTKTITLLKKKKIKNTVPIGLIVLT